MDKIDCKKGFTLVEVLIAMLVTLVMMAGGYSVFNTYQKQTTIQSFVSDAQQTLRAAMDFMVREIRMAGYDPDRDRNTGITDIKFDGDGNSTVTFTYAVDNDGDGNIDGEKPDQLFSRGYAHRRT